MGIGKESMFTTGFPPPAPIAGASLLQQTVLASGNLVPAVPAAVPTSSPDSASKRVTVWNRDTKRKISGNAAPMEKNLAEYLRRHPECELYNGQDQQLDPAEKAALIAAQNRIAIWNKAERRRVSGNAAPSEKNLHEYLRKHPECEIYNGQDKRPGEWTGKPPTVVASPMPAYNGGIRSDGAPRGSQPTSSPAMAIPSSKPSGDAASAMPIPTNMSIADMYTAGEAPFATDPFGQDVFGMSGSLGKMSGKSLEDMMMGMSMDSTMDGLGGSIGDLLASSPSNIDALGGLGPTKAEAAEKKKNGGNGGGTQPIPMPMSPAQRIKRDRAASMRNRALSVGSDQGHPAQRLRQGPGPGSLKSDDVLGWSISPSMLDEEL